MKKLQCEMCGSQDLVKQDGVFVCQSCGTKYSVEEAKKMMVEGTVQVAGTVKVDKSEELKNLYILAERARKSNNSDNAVRYYNQILEKDPNSWQANFYLVYFKAKNINVGSIPNVCYDLINCYQSTFELLIDDKGQDIVPELEILIEDIYNYSISIVNSTWRMHEDHIYFAKAIEILSRFGDELINVYGDTYKETALKSWNKSMEVLQYIFSRCENQEIANCCASLIAYSFNINELQGKISSHVNSYSSLGTNNGVDDDNGSLVVNNEQCANQVTGTVLVLWTFCLCGSMVLGAPILAIIDGESFDGPLVFFTIISPLSLYGLIKITKKYGFKNIMNYGRS